MFPQRTLTTYVVAVIIVMAVVIGICWLRRIRESTESAGIFPRFLFGMIAKYIAMHVYRDDIWPWISS
jgi:hypothetical protein